MNNENQIGVSQSEIRNQKLNNHEKTINHYRTAVHHRHVAVPSLGVRRLICPNSFYYAHHR
jgi:hypothetical protein